MPLVRVGVRTDSTTRACSYNANARRGQFPRTRIGILCSVRRTLVLFINPRRACAARVTVVGFVILSVKRDLTSRMSNRAISECAYSVACERQKICGEFPETAAF